MIKMTRMITRKSRTAGGFRTRKIRFFECTRCGAELTQSGIKGHLMDIIGYSKDTATLLIKEAIEEFEVKQEAHVKTKEDLKKWGIEID